MLKQTKKACEEILEVINKHKDIFDIDISYEVKDLDYRLKAYIFGLELKESYGLNVNHKDIRSTDFTRFNDYVRIGAYGKKHNRTISWSSDGRQPEDEVLLVISFSTGAYIFGDDYPTELFKEFFLELKTYKPDYVDDANKALYWKIENAKDIFNSFESILDKYNEVNKKDIKIREIERLQKKIQELKTE